MRAECAAAIFTGEDAAQPHPEGTAKRSSRRTRRLLRPRQEQTWPALIKFTIILVVAIPPMLASYHLLVRFTFIGAVLNGRSAEKRVLSHGGIATA